MSAGAGRLHRGSKGNGGRIGLGRRKAHSLNPLESVVNLTDILLIFACGLMVAIVSLWNLDVTKEMSTDPAEQNTYEDVGQVYVDPDTGELYIVTTDTVE